MECACACVCVVQNCVSRITYNITVCAAPGNEGRYSIGMANYEKQVEQEAAYPIPISLYNCYRTVRHEKRYQEYIDSYASLLLPHCPVTVVQRYRDGVCSLLFHLFFKICPSFRRNDNLYLFYPFLTLPNAPSKSMLEYRCKKEMLIPR